jgi:hypothetical protein
MDLMLQKFSTFRSLTVLRLSGQFRIGLCPFGTHLIHFPALATFHLGIGPDTADGEWFFVKDDPKRSWAKAVEADPEWADYIELMKAGVLRQDPLPGPPVRDPTDLSEVDYYPIEDEPPRRYRTLPNHATLGPVLRSAAQATRGMPKIERFSVCLEDNFDEDGRETPFVPPFLTRVFELHYVKKAEGKNCPTLTFKLGQKVDYWRPEDIVLEAWRVATGGENSRLEISFIE